MSSFQQQQKNESCKEIIKYGPFTGEKKEVDRNFPWGSPDIGLNRQRL